MLRIVLFGGLMVSWGESPLPTIASTVARSLFAYLLTYRDRPHTRDLVTGTFWPELPDDVARRRLSQALWQIRKALEPHEIVLTEGDTLQINPDLPLWLDVEQFARHQKQGTADQAGAIEQGERCVALYKGDFLAGYYDDWLFPERERLRELFLDVLDRLVVGYKRRGDYGTALAHARRLVSEDPLREQAHREVMRLCHLLGRDAEALQQFEVCCQILTEELGVEPSHKTAALAREITERGGQAPSLDLPQPLRPSAAFLLDAAQGPELPLVGREVERAELLAHVQVLFQGLGGLVLVEGEAGVGKTRLLRAIAGDAEWRGAEVLWGRGQQAAASAPFGPLVEALSAGLGPLRAGQLGQIIDEIWLQVLAALLPPLDAALPHRHPPPALEPAQERDRLVNALAQLLAGWARIVPLLLVVEDLQWAGHDALDLLARLVPLLGDGGVLILGSYRSEEARARPETWQRLQALDRAGVRQRLVLNRLDATATGRLVRRSLGLGGPAPLFESRLFTETQGNPLFVLETLRALHGEGLLSRDEHGRWSTPWDDVTADYAELPLPRAVEQIIARRLEALAPPLRETILLAAVLGEHFDFDLLSAAGVAEAHDLLGRLRQLVQRRFLDETEHDYRFHHDKIRQVASAGIAPADRRQLHARVARTLESLRPEQVAALAHHWAGAQAWDKAAAYHRRAGERAAEVHASAEAVEHYTRALALLDRLPGADPAGKYELLLAREAIHDQQGQREAQAEDLNALDGLLQAWQAAASSGAQRAEDEPTPPALTKQRAEVAFRRARYTGGLADYAAAVPLFQEAVHLARVAQAVALEAEGRYQWARMLALQGQWAEADQQLGDVLEAARQGHLQDLEARLLGTLTQFAVERGNYDDARLWGQQALHLFRERGDRRGEGLVHNGLGLTAAFQGDYGTAQSHFTQALDLARETGNIIGQGHALFDLGLLTAEQGDPVQARAYYEQALRIFTQVEDREHENRILNNLGVTLCQVGAYPEAQAHFEHFLNNCRQLGSRYGQVVALVNLAYVSQCLGKHQAALEQGRQALHGAEELGERRAQGYVWTIIGDALAGLDRLEEAEAAYRQALALRQELGQPNLAMESLAGLVRLALTRGDPGQAGADAGEIVEHLKTGSLAGTKDPFLVYLSCYRALRAIHDPHADQFLADAHRRLQEQAARITDDQLRRSFLDRVAAHREIVAAYAAQQAHNQREVRLPRAEAPTGRPLRDDEYVTVTWTLVAPEDEPLPPGPARRQAQLLRLLREAAEQGAAPGVGDLAAALAVSEPTVRRDLAALRRAGHPVRTRGSRGG